MERFKKLYRYISVFIYLFFFASIWETWVTVGGKSYGLFGYIVMVQKAGGIGSIARGDPGLTVSYFFFFIPAVLGVLALLYAISKCIRYPSVLLHKVIIWGMFIYSVAGIILFPRVPALWTWLIPILCTVDFILSQYLDQRDELIQADLERKKREKEEEEERKRRLYFPGRYSSYYYKMILKNVRYHIRNYVMLIISGTFFMLFLFLMFALLYTFQQVHTEETIIIGGGMQKILLEAIWIGLALNAVLMGLSFSYYMRNKLREENALVLLGIRNKSLTSIMIMEYIGCLACSALLGIILGNGAFRILLILIRKKVPIASTGLPLGYSAILVAIFVSAALVAAAVNSEVYNHMRWDAAGLLVKKNKIPGRRAWVYGIIGCLFILKTLYALTTRNAGEGVGNLADFLIGVYLVLLCVRAAMVKGTKKGEAFYYQHVFHHIPFLTKFKKNTNKLFLLFAVCFLIMYTFTAEYAGIAAAPSAEKLFPYDYVCMAPKEEEQTFTELKEEHSLKISKYPMVRLTVAMADNGSLLDMLNGEYMKQILGQQVGISESTYRLLKESAGEKESPSLNLKGEEIHIVYQEDSSVKSHPLDWYLPSKGPYISLGDGASSFKDVKSEETCILTGMFEGGVEENIVVYSDEYFDKVYKEAVGRGEQTLLYLINNAGGKEDRKAKTALKEFGKRYQPDPNDTNTLHFYYEKQQNVKDLETERYLKQVVWMFVLFMVGSCGIYLLFIKFCFEMDDIVKRYRFLDCMGMYEKKLKATLRKEMISFWRVPLLAGGIASAVFTALMFKTRMYDGALILRYMKYAVPIWLVYLALQIMVYIIIRKILLNEIFKTGGGKA